MAAGNTYESIATQTLGSAAASVTFSSIPATYTDLILVVSGLSDNSANIYEAMYMQVNSDTGSNYSNTSLYGDGSSATSGRATSATSVEITRLNSTFSSNTAPGTEIVHLQNYSNATTYKTFLGRTSNIPNGNLNVGAVVGLWRSTAAITSIKVGPVVGTNFVAGSTFSLYGIKAA